MKAWMRVLRVTLTQDTVSSNGKLKQLVFGANEESGVTRQSVAIGNATYSYRSSDLAISISGDKYMSTLKDCCTIKIKNLTYVEIVQIITGRFFNVKVECGYRSGNTFTIFDGGVMYISNLRESVETNTVTILCASRLVAVYGQRRMNLSFNSGVNLYSAIKFVCKVGGVPNYNLSTQFKKRMLEDILNCENENAAEVIDDMVSTNGALVTCSDCVGSSYLTAYDASKSNCRIIKLDESNIMLTSGFPKMTTDGLVLSIMPTFQFQCGDTIVIDNALIQIDVQSQSDATKNLGALLDESGQYVIFEMHYELENRADSFYIQINAKTRSKLAAQIGSNRS